MFCPNCGMQKNNCICAYNKSTEDKSNFNEKNKEVNIDFPQKIQEIKFNEGIQLKISFEELKNIPNQSDKYSGKIEFKNYTQGSLVFVNVRTKNSNKSGRPLFMFKDSYYKSEDFVIHYYESKGYNAFFSENNPWRKLLKILFKDIFKKFKMISKQKGYKSGFYDNEFFVICEDDINDRINYLKNISLIDEVKKHYIKDKLNDKILKICEFVEDDKILSILYFMLQDYNHRIKGFPDLFVFNNDEFFFCEVKANTDALSAYQVRNHEYLLKIGINVCIFTINKSQTFINEEKWKYFNEDFYDVNNFKEEYDFKIKVANRIHKELENNQINEIKIKFLSYHDLYTYLGFLNLIKDYSLDKKVETLGNIDENIINQSKNEGIKIKNLYYLSKGLYYEERGLYSQAIEEYKNAKDFYGYNKLCICYRKNKDYENEVNLTYDVINNISEIPSDCKIYFKNRAQRFTKNKKRILVYKTNNKCPICGNDEVIVVLQRRNNLQIRICENGSCYWYGGIYDSKIYQLEQVTDLEGFNIDVNLKKSTTKFSNIQRRKKQRSLFKKGENSKNYKKHTKNRKGQNELNEGYAKNLEIKYDLIKKGESLLNKEYYDDSIEFYTKLINHEFFINDYYPFVMLVKSYKGLKQHDKEVEVIKQFFKSGRYCKKFTLRRFKKRLQELDELGYFDYSTINELEEEFRNNGAKNMNMSRIPLPRARDIKSSKKRLKQTPLKYSPDYFDSYVEFDNDSSYDDKIKFKHELILKGENLFKTRKYSKSIAFYARLLTHELFINDYYPYIELAKVLHKDKRYIQEVDVIEQFFKSGIYCDKKQINWFKRRLKRLTKFGYYDFSKFSSLEYEFYKNGDLNESLSNQPVPSALIIKEMYK